MFAAVLFIAGIHTVVGFNIFQKPESKFTNEDPLFGPITVHSKDGFFDPTPKDQLLLQEQNAMKSNNNNNNNKYQSNQPPLHQDPLRKRRSPQNDAITNEDEGTEIAFVLDGSGSIEQEDFERAKEFIHNVMRNVWTTCLSCKFAVVQYGRDIRTELSLNENDERLKALHKVKNIKQIHAITKTASALYYVLTDIFVPQSGSKENTKKMIILLSDGQMAGDNRTLTEVLNMPQMKRIVRYAIGVGPEVLNKTQAVKEMTEIAGSEDRFFSVCNYAALDNILSSLEKTIIKIGEMEIRKEITFVLDGSGSIMPEDFERAKDFISNVMKNVWTTCLSCRFAVVQYGREIRTELSLNESNDNLRALDKVKSIKQLFSITRTASALYHVLTEVFVPQSGSKENAKKIIILLSDGQMAGDTKTLTEVLNMPQMEGIVRYAIGIGPEVLDKSWARKEMTEIAGSEERFIKVTNYADLKDILHSLEQNIIRTEEEDAGIEIAFVLDGSGSIEQEDFEWAKAFIINVMNNVWVACSSCRFAVVQYGRDIRTELSLKENTDSLGALDKVKNIKQIDQITKTASAIYHVLTEVFVPQSGSKGNEKKNIILLSDGRMGGDNRSLTEVLDMPQMEGIVRYAIGLGPEVLNDQQAILEMTEIAGGDERFLKVSNYDLLKSILSSLEESILRTAGRGIRQFCNS